MKTFTACCSIGVILSTFAMAGASAASPTPRYERSATVYVADLDLTTERGARVLYERIDYAAHSLCIAEDISPDVNRRYWRECIETAIADAVVRANAPVLTAIHLQMREQLARL